MEKENKSHQKETRVRAHSKEWYLKNDSFFLQQPQAETFADYIRRTEEKKHRSPIRVILSWLFIIVISCLYGSLVCIEKIGLMYLLDWWISLNILWRWITSIIIYPTIVAAILIPLLFMCARVPQISNDISPTRGTRFIVSGMLVSSLLWVAIFNELYLECVPYGIYIIALIIIGARWEDIEAKERRKVNENKNEQRDVE